MTFQATVYQIMVASPGDVVDERIAFDEVLYEWNALHSQQEGVVLLPIRWETHSTPDLKDRSQSIINKQLVYPSDILIGIYWTKVGTPTGVAESGTEEEIEAFLAAKKPVHLYFSNKPVPPSAINPEEHRRVLDLKQRYYSIGLVGTFSSLDEFQKKLSNDITRTIQRLKGSVVTQGFPQQTTQGARSPQLSFGFWREKTVYSDIVPEIIAIEGDILTDDKIDRNLTEKKAELQMITATFSGRVTQEELEEYIEEYNQYLLSFESALKQFQAYQLMSRFSLNFVLANTGTASATDVTLTLEFPVGSVIEESMDKLTSYKEVDIPARPVPTWKPSSGITVSQLKSNPLLAQSALSSINTFNSLSKMFTPPITPPIFTSSLMYNSNKTSWGPNIRRNNVTYKISKLQHGSRWEMKPVCVMISQEDFKIQYSIRVEELPHSIDGELSVMLRIDKE